MSARIARVVAGLLLAVPAVVFAQTGPRVGLFPDPSGQQGSITPTSPLFTLYVVANDLGQDVRAFEGGWTGMAGDGIGDPSLPLIVGQSLPTPTAIDWGDGFWLIAYGCLAVEPSTVLVEVTMFYDLDGPLVDHPICLTASPFPSADPARPAALSCETSEVFSIDLAPNPEFPGLVLDGCVVLNPSPVETVPSTFSALKARF